MDTLLKSFAIANKGTENFCAKEIKDLINANCKILDRAIIFETEKYEDLCKLSYLGQSFSRVVLHMGDFEFEENLFLKLEENILSSKINNWLHEGITFRTECLRLGEHNFTSVDVEQKSGGFILKKCEGKVKVDLRRPTLIVFIFVVDTHCYFGVDFSGFDQSLREYKIFSHRESLNGSIAYCLLRLSDWNKKEIIVDPFCGSATIPIEAAFWQTGISHNQFRKEKLAFTHMELGFDQKKFFDTIDKKIKFPDKISIFGSDMLLASVNASEKNAKIAGIHKAVKVMRMDMEWLDTKFEENTISKIVTHFPDSIKNLDDKDDEKKLEKLYKEFFYQVDFSMKKKNASIIAICNYLDTMKKNAEEFGFKIDGKFEFWQGKEKLNIVKFVR